MLNKEMLLYSFVLLFGVFISAISQTMLKKAAMKKYDSVIAEYLNPMVIFAYVLFVGTTFLSIISYKVIPLSMGPVLESTGYFYVTIFGAKFFGEKITIKKIMALLLIFFGILIYSFFG